MDLSAMDTAPQKQRGPTPEEVAAMPEKDRRPAKNSQGRYVWMAKSRKHCTPPDIHPDIVLRDITGSIIYEDELKCIHLTGTPAEPKILAGGVEYTFPQIDKVLLLHRESEKKKAEKQKKWANSKAGKAAQLKANRNYQDRMRAGNEKYWAERAILSSQKPPKRGVHTTRNQSSLYPQGRLKEHNVAIAAAH
jgi:hypothetical protein